MVVLQVVTVMMVILMASVIVYGFYTFDEWEAGIEFLPKDYNNFELGISNRNYIIVGEEDRGLEQEIRIGFILFTLFILFRRFDA